MEGKIEQDILKLSILQRQLVLINNQSFITLSTA